MVNNKETRNLDLDELLNNLDDENDKKEEEELSSENEEESTLIDGDDEENDITDEEALEENKSISEKAIKKNKKVDLEERYRNSTKEAQTLYFQNKRLENVIDEAVDVAEPTEEELRSYAKLRDADYDSLDSFAKSILKDTLMNSKGLEMLRKAREEAKKANVWVEKVTDFVTDEITIQKYPSLDGREDEFIKFANVPSRRGLDLDDLVAIFNYRNPLPVKKNRGALLLDRGNGRSVPPKEQGISAEELASIRTRDPKKYRRMIKSNKVKIDL